MNRQLRHSLLFVTVLSGILLSFGPSSFLQDPDILWHTVVGKQIIDSGTLPRSDEFTFSFRGEQWIPSQWLAESGMGVLDRSFGFTGLALAATAVLVLTYSWGSVRLHRMGLNWLVALFFAAVIMAASSYHFHARPHLFTILFSAVLVERLAAVERRSIPIPSLLPLIPLFCLWTNLHGGVLGGLGSLGLVFGGWTLAYLTGRPSPVECRRHLGWLTGLALTCVATIFVNPYGIGIPKMWMRIMSADLPHIVIEHAPLSLRKPHGVIILLLALSYGAILGGTRRFPRMTWLLPLVWFFLAVNRIRHGPIFAVVTLFVLPDVLANSRFGEWLKRHGWYRPKEEASPPSTALGFPQRAAAFALYPLAFLACYAAIWPAAYGTWAAEPAPRIWPSALREDLRRLQDKHGRPTRLFNEQRLAGFVLYNAPGFLIFIDGRCELFGEEFLEKYMAVLRSPAKLKDWEAAKGIRVAIVGTNSRLNQYFSSSAEWTLVRGTPYATLYERRDADKPAGDCCP